MKPTNKPVQLTPALLRSIIEEEVEKFGKMEDTEDRAKDAEETDADELADSPEKHIDFMKALKIEEARLTKRLRAVRETRQRVAKSLLAKI
jgi:hypothetical protein